MDEWWRCIFSPTSSTCCWPPSMCGGNREPSTHGVGWYALLYINAPALIWILPPQKLKTQVYSWCKVSQSAQRGNPTVSHQKVEETLVEVQPIRPSLVPCVWLFSSFFIISDEEQEFGIIFYITDHLWNWFHIQRLQYIPCMNYKSFLSLWAGLP